MFEELDTILASKLITPYFMPIVCIERQHILGFEALARGPAGSHLHAPLNLFNAATKAGRLLDLELQCRESAVRHFQRLQLPGLLFLNVTPNALLEPDFESGRTQQLLSSYELDPQRLVVEITEQYPIDDYALMRDATRHYQEAGFAVAIDDLGAGYAGLRSWSELHPQYVKIDHHFIQGIHKNLTKQEFVRSIREMAKGLGCEVIAEGIECREESATLQRLGISLQQGFFFARPLPTPAKTIDTALFSELATTGHASRPPNALRLKSITTAVHPMLPTTPLKEAANRFRSNPYLRAIPITEGKIPCGLLQREHCLRLFLNSFGHELYDNKPVARFMDTQPLLLEHDMPIELASQLITKRQENTTSYDFILVDNGEYWGMGNVLDLLRRIIEPPTRRTEWRRACAG